MRGWLTIRCVKLKQNHYSFTSILPWLKRLIDIDKSLYNPSLTYKLINEILMRISLECFMNPFASRSFSKIAKVMHMSSLISPIGIKQALACQTKSEAQPIGYDTMSAILPGWRRLILRPQAGFSFSLLLLDGFPAVTIRLLAMVGRYPGQALPD